ncbi:membrane hypothetical protein [Bradyrhizobium sp. ORS 375]|uniref:hypothetical protein n=1 Tax=Bradyrhizobium sp. (strain ORS 375) TaxID=566679 RepID=UPI000240961D|nr:hypothetical protein [Bradyrhizobium sp. ORS 375]CCD91622.1 membrane hypothetical protein [Bradyrhizobium sp. ORS 375]
MKSSVAEWQRLLLPVMIIALAGSAIFFAWQSVYEFADLKRRVSAEKVDLSRIFDQFEKAGEGRVAAGRFEYIQWKSLVYLEQETIQHRYGQGAATILARAWTRLLGFTTGMVLAIVGAAFILGKMQESPSELRHESEGIKVALVTSSPGIVLAVLGSVLMSITLLSRFDIEIHDVGTYVSNSARPRDLPDPSTLMRPKGLSAGREAEKTESDPAKGGTP